MLYYFINGGNMNKDWIKVEAKKRGITEQQFLAMLLASGVIR